MTILFLQKGGNPNDDTIGAIGCLQYQDSYDVTFHDFTSGHGPRMDIKIDLMNQLKKKVKEVAAKNYAAQVD